MQDEISPKEFSEWIAYSKICPIGLERFDYLAALIAHSSLCAAGAKIDFEDVMPDFDAEHNEKVRNMRKNKKLFDKAKMSAKLLNFKSLQDERKRLGIK